LACAGKKRAIDYDDDDLAPILALAGGRRDPAAGWRTGAPHRRRTVREVVVEAYGDGGDLPTMEARARVATAMRGSAA
jgi:hypothetical protein